ARPAATRLHTRSTTSAGTSASPNVSDTVTGTGVPFGTVHDRGLQSESPTRVQSDTSWPSIVTESTDRTGAGRSSLRPAGLATVLVADVSVIGDPAASPIAADDEARRASTRAVSDVSIPRASRSAGVASGDRATCPPLGRRMIGPGVDNPRRHGPKGKPRPGGQPGTARRRA